MRPGCIKIQYQELACNFPAARTRSDSLMAKDSQIEWTHHTFNPWWGCVKLSPACAHCYAESWARRFGDELWGGDAPRRFFGEQHWREPLRWNADAGRLGTRTRVFCASMADVFEPRSDLDPWRMKLWSLIEKTPHLDWLLLTKRPGHIKHVYPWARAPRVNVWLGATAENQRWATRRIDRLLAVDARVRFLSCEPLLSAIDLTPWLKQKQITWIIAGGESGHSARPTHPNWIRSLRDQSQRHEVPFHFKQWGHWSPESQGETVSRMIELRDEAGRLERLSWRPNLRSGRVLDGQTWDGYP
jgi:protein gp37